MGETATITASSALKADGEPRRNAPDVPAVSVVMAPAQSVLTLLMQAASGQSRGAPASLLAAIRYGLRPQSRFAAQSFTERGWTHIPDSCTPLSPLADSSVPDHAARLRDLPTATLTRELLAADGGDCPPCWRPAAEQPRRWLNSTAAVRGGMAALLNSLHPGLRYQDGAFTYTPPCNQFALRSLGPVGPRHLVLVPMIAGCNAVLFSFDVEDVCFIGYQVPRPRAGGQHTADSALATILGPVRAAILQVLRQALTVGDVAVAVHCAPTTATYHLHQLAKADLIAREKSGSSVWISRTARGDELVDLLSD